MHPADSPRPNLGRRIGFWLGLTLFAVILAAPVTESMRQAGRRSLRTQVRAEIKKECKTRSRSDAGGQDLSVRVDAYLDDHREWFEQESERRARAMIPAAAVTALVACWWITVAVPIPATSLIPLTLFPLLGVMPFKSAAVCYADANIFLFMGGFIIALGIERSGLHRRLALHIVSLVGTGQATIVLGFMIASAFVSMWISNTATTLMMLPIGLAVAKSLPALTSADTGDPRASNLGPALMLGIAYACSIGGVGTPIGTPPNIAYQGQVHELFPDAPQISFGQWMIAFLPIVVLFIPCAWLILTRVTCPLPRAVPGPGRSVVRDHLRALGRISPAERWMLGIFVTTALLWMFRKRITIGTFTLAGWSDLLADFASGWFKPAYLHDATVGMFMALLLFLIPCGRDPQGRRDRLMDWDTARKLPWGILLLFGGGFAIAAGFQQTGLSAYLGGAFRVFGGTPPLLMVMGVCLLLTFMTELTSNTATTLVMLPILARAAAESLAVNPLIIMLPATVSASCAFMLPVATPPNAIVFGSGLVRMSHMVKSGLLLNLVGVILVSLCMYLVVLPLLGQSPELPAWAG
jgi:sodium-dependent dicarboxylate transporter 2/3/5